MPFNQEFSLLLAVLAHLAVGASLERVNAALANNPTKVGFYIYVPDALASKPPILVNPHWCHGDATAAYRGSQFASFASQYGFIVIYPDSPNTGDKCWDVSSKQTLTHNGGGDSLGIVSMVNWTLDRYEADAGRVFVTGVSSGAMMTSTLIGAYPDVFAAGSAFSGVPFGCFAPRGDNTAKYDFWNGDCANGLVTHNGSEWAALVRAAYPGYTGWRPKMQIFHGTADQVLNYTAFTEEIKEWTTIFGYSTTPSSTTPNTPQPNWTKYTYGPDNWFQAYSAAGVSHNIPVQDAVVMDWLGLRCTGKDCFRWGEQGPSASTKST